MPQPPRAKSSAPKTDPAPDQDALTPAAQENGKGDADEAVARRGRLIIPATGPNGQTTGWKVSHDTLVSREVLAEHDARDADRADRAAAIFTDARYSGTLTAGMLRKLTPLLREPISPRDIVTTGPAEKGKPIVTTGIRSVQVQVDRLTEVLGGAHFRLIPHHTADGTRCRMHVVIGNDLQWCRLDRSDANGSLVPYTVLEGTTVVRESDILVHADGWGGHNRGTAPGDVWKGSETNAGKRVIARVGPGAHVYALDFEDDPHDTSKPPRERSQQQRQPSPDVQAQQQSGEPDATPEQYEAALAAVLAQDDNLKALRNHADEGLQKIGAGVRRRLATLNQATTKAKLDDVIKRINLALDADDEGQASLLDPGVRS